MQKLCKGGENLGVFYKVSGAAASSIKGSTEKLC